MKIMQINCVYKYGSTGKILLDLEELFTNKGHQVINIYSNNIKNGVKSYKVLNMFQRIINTLYTYISGYMYKGSMLSTLKIIRIIKKHQPDIVNLHSINGHMVNIYTLLKWLKKNKIPTVVTNHAEFFYTGSYTHIPDGSTQWKLGEKEHYFRAKKLTNSLFFDKTYEALCLMKSAFEGFNYLTIVSVSPWVKDRSSSSFILGDKYNITILNGLDTSIFKPTKSNLREQLGLRNEKIILHVTSSFTSEIKGSKYLLELANECKEQDFKFLVVGVDDDLVLPDNCINIGKIKDPNILAKFYTVSDITVITSLKETFSMVVAESLSCGTPVVGFKAGGPETIAIKEYSKFVDFGNVVDLKKEMINMIGLRNDKISKEAHLIYDRNIMAEEYLRAYNELIKKKEISRSS